MNNSIDYLFKNPNDFDIIRDGYGNTLVQACITMITTVYSEPRFVEKKDGEPIENSPITFLLDKPNIYESGASFRKKIAEDVAVYGNAYILIERNRAGKALSLKVLPASMVTPLEDDNEIVIGYQVNSVKGIRKYLSNDVIHLTWFITEPLNRFLGLSPMFSAMRAIETYNEIQRHVAGTMSRGGMSPMFAITQAVGADGSMQKGTQEAYVNTFRRAWSRMFGKTQNSIVNTASEAPIIILKEGQDIKALGFDIKQLEAPILLKQMEVQICSAFRVPPELAISNAGIENSTYNNLLNSSRNFISMTMKPLWVLHSEQITNKLADTKNGYYIETNFNEISATEPSRNELISIYDKAYLSRVVTIDEYRNVLDLAPLDSSQLSELVQVEAIKTKDDTFYSIQNMDYYTKALDVIVNLETAFGKAHKRAGKSLIEEIEAELAIRYPNDTNVNLSVGLDAVGADFFEKEYIKEITNDIPKLANSVISWAGNQVDFTPTKNEVDDLISQFDEVVRNTASDSGATLFARLKVLSATVPSGNLSEVIKKLRVGGNDIVEGNATVSSRTLATRLTNETSVNAWSIKDKKLRRDGKRIKKVWFTQRDKRVRPAHRLMEGQEVDVDQAFTYQAMGVDAEGNEFPIGEPNPMQYPVDITAENVGEGANCRCVTRPIIVSL